MSLLAVGFGLADAGNVVAGPRAPQVPQLFALAAETNEAGVTLGDILNDETWALLTHPLASDVLGRLGAMARRTPAPGLQVELLTPGDVGATLCFRW